MPADLNLTLKYKNSQVFNIKQRFSPDFIFEGESVYFFYTYIRKNASTSFKKLFQALYPYACPGDLPSIRCMLEHTQVKGLTPEQIDQRFATKLFVYRDPIDRVFSVYKNKLIQQDGAEDLLSRLEKVVGRDPALLTFHEFVHEYVVLLETERWEEVDGHLYPQVWHLLPITYTKVIRMDNVYKEMRELLPEELCDRSFKEPYNSTTKGSVPLAWADPDCPAIYFRKKYARGKALPSLTQLLTPATEAHLREVYAYDYRMIEEVEGKPASFMLSETPLPAGFNFSLPFMVEEVAHERDLGLDFSPQENSNAEVWMDDTIRQDEKDICERWARDYGFELQYVPLEVGLGRLTRPDANTAAATAMSETAVAVLDDDAHPEHALGLDFSLPEARGRG